MLKLQQQPTIVENRFRGLPHLAHGGYVAGVMATALGAAEAEVRLRRPVRPGRTLDIAHTGADAVELREGDTLLARATHTELSLDVPAPVTPADAELASDHFLGRHSHVFPGCFVCGTERAVGDGLRIFPGPVEGRALVAAPWVPPGDGLVPDEFVWAAFDCTQLWSLIAHAPADSADRVVTATLAAWIGQPVAAGEPYVLVGWPIGRDERGWVAGAALYGADGELRAAGRQHAVLTDWGVPLPHPMAGRTPQPKEEQPMTTHVISTAQPSGLAELKQAHRRIWASGSYASVAERIVDDVPPRHLLERVRIEPGMEVLDLATGTGNVAIRAAQLGARVTGLDLTPELLGRARERAAAAGVEVAWVTGDAEDLPFEDGSFDVVLSTFGIQFAPRHEVAASEAARVARPGGTIGFINWTPQGHIGRVLKAVGALMPKPPAYASPPPLWGDDAHVRALLEPEGVELTTEKATNPFVGFTSPEEFVRFMETNYGPLLKAREKLAPEGEWGALRGDILALTTAFDRGYPGAMHVDSEYLLVLGRVVRA